MARSSRVGRALNRLARLRPRTVGGRTTEIGDEPMRIAGAVRLSRKHGPFVLTTGTFKLMLLFDWPMNPASSPYPLDWIIAQDQEARGVVPFLRLQAGANEVIDYDNRGVRKIFGITREMGLPGVEISNVSGDLEISVENGDVPVVVQRAQELPEEAQFSDERLKKLQTLREIYGGDFRVLEHNEAIDAAATARTLFQQGEHRPLNSSGQPGGLLDLPSDFVPIIIGDLHGAVDNLLKALCQNRFLELMDAGQGGLILLGDVIHGEQDGKLDNVTDSTLMLDLIFKLKARFPTQVFMLRGNHESFNPDIVKGGVPQGLLYRKHLMKTRGEEYVNLVSEFFESLPFVARSDRFVATHAAPTRGRVTYDILVDLAKYPGLIHDVTWNRLRRPGFPGGYSKGDVKRFRKSLNVEKDTPMIVGHTPLDGENTYWVRAGNIKQHYIVYSARADRFGVVTMLNDGVIALDYNCEKLTPLTETDG